MTVSLEKHAKTKLLFKFQSFRQPIVDQGSPASGELRPRKIAIKVLDDKSSFPIQQMLVMIQPQDLIYDQVFRYYEPKLSLSKTPIPNFIAPLDTDVQPKLAECEIRCSNPKIELSMTAHDGLEATLMNRAAQTMEEAIIYIYRDKLRTQLLGAAKVEIHAADAVCIELKAGEE